MARQISPKLYDTWRRRVERQRQGSLTVTQFCKREGVSTANFYVWKRRLQDSDGVQVSTTTPGRPVSRQKGAPAPPSNDAREHSFMQVPFATVAPSPWIEIVLAEGAVVRLPQQNLAALQTVLQSLGGVATSRSEVRRA
jgi:hypothetical protein